MLHAFITTPGFEGALAAEIGARGPAAAEPRWPAVVTVREPADADPVFALQALPGVALVRGGSVHELADAARAVVAPALAEGGPFSLHAYVPDPQSYRTVAGSARVVGETFLSLLGETRRRHEPWPREWPRTVVVQIAVVGRSSALVSAGRPRPVPGGGLDVAPWPAGRAPVAEDRAAPSRAYRKLEEAFAWLGRAPAEGERCVDLGGSPGGWAWTALKRGARVVAVDRSPLAAPAAGHPRLEALIGNAFTYRPPSPVDWLLCDVICEPARTFALVEAWMAAGLCRHLVATVKFKGQGGYDLLGAARARLMSHRWSFVRVKHLYHHHNEAAIMASR